MNLYHGRAIMGGFSHYLIITSLKKCLNSTFHSKSVAMVTHGMDIIKRITGFFNTGQTPVFIADQPLYTIPKQSQLNCPNSSYIEDRYFVMFGEFHIQSAAIGSWLENSGWTGMMFYSMIFHIYFVSAWKPAT